MRAVYDQLGVSFQYPDNWTLDVSDLESGGDVVSVYSPGGAFWSVTVHPRRAEPAQLADEALDVLKKEYPDFDAETVTETLDDRELVGYDANFIYLDLTNTALVRGIRTNRATYVILCQAEDREFERIAPVFRAMTTSLLQEERKGVTR